MHQALSQVGATLGLKPILKSMDPAVAPFSASLGYLATPGWVVFARQRHYARTAILVACALRRTSRRLRPLRRFGRSHTNVSLTAPHSPRQSAEGCSGADAAIA